jgi:predicted dehydrogenase
MDTASSEALERGRQLPLAVIGCGRVFERFHLPALRSSREFRLVGLCDSSAERRAQLASAFPAAVVSGEASAALAVPHLAAVLVATPPAWQRAIAVEALESGLHVLVEKPMGGSAADAAAMRTAARAAKRVLRVGFVRRHRRSYLALRRALQDPARVDEVGRVTCRMVFSPGTWDAYSGYLERRDPGGGVLEDVASHQVDLMAWLFGSRIQRVRARDWTWLPTGERVDYELELASGRRIECSAEHGPRYHEEIRINLGRRVVLAHPYGVLALPRPLSGPLRSLARLTGTVHLASCKLTRRPNLTQQSCALQLVEFARAIRGNEHDERAAEPDGGSGWRCQMVLESLRESRVQEGAWRAIPAPEP